ncbi:MAG: hypothetical protein D6681_03275 [Calditrichaeota bacterium]|nr:MAG: hypothetical protein D6681_03275 [Calditrichota bacterium]
MTNLSPVFEILVIGLALAAILWVVWYSFKQKQKTSLSNAYTEALEHLVDGNDRLAIQKFKEAVRQDTENVAAYLRLGDLLRRKGLLSNAIRIHRDLTLRATLTPEQELQILKSLLRDYQAAGEFDQGIQVARKILRKERTPESWVVQALVDMLEKTGRWKEAGEVVERYGGQLPVEQNRRLALYLVFQGMELQEQGNGKEARVKFKEALKKDPRCAAAYYYLGKSYRDEDRIEDAVKVWKELCEKAPEKAHIVFPELEKAWFELGRYADAENLYLEMMHSDKKGLLVGLALADIYSKKGEYDSALEILHRLEEEYHNSPLLIGKKVNVYFHRGQYKQAASQSLSFFNSTNGAVAVRYRCSVCNYESKTPRWVCPECHSIDTFSFTV